MAGVCGGSRRPAAGKGPTILTPAAPLYPHPQEKADRAALEEEVRNLRNNNRLLLASQHLGSPATDLA